MTIDGIARSFGLYDRIASYFAQPTKGDVETFISIVEAFVAEAEHDYGAKTTVLMPPDGDVYIARSGYAEAQVIERLRRAAIDVLVDELPKIADPELYWIPDDGHPTALSNQARARNIADHLQKVDPSALKTAFAP